MTHLTNDQCLGITGAVLASLSAIAAFYIVISGIKLRKTIRKTRNYNALFLVESVQFMAICDVILELLWVWIFVSMADPNNFGNWSVNLPNGICILRGLTIEYFEAASVSWNGLIAFNLFRILLFNTRLSQFIKEIEYYHLYVWLVALLMTIIPLFNFNNNWEVNTIGYGKVDNNGTYFECWINKSIFQLSFYIPAIFYFIVAFCLLIYVMYLRIGGVIPNLNMKLVYYTVVFVITWICLITERVYSIFNFKSSHSAPTLLLWLHHLAAASIGLGNALVWGASNMLENAKKSSTVGGAEYIDVDETLPTVTSTADSSVQRVHLLE